MAKGAMAMIQPKPDGRCAARIPLRALRVGTRLRLPVTMASVRGETKSSALCTIIEIYEEKHWLRCEYECGKTKLHECYQYLVEEG